MGITAMTFSSETSLYDILDIRPDASPQEVREAYLRTKAAYGKDSVALYTLIGADERESMLSQIQNAYETLSNEDRRREYDRRHGHLESDADARLDAPVRAPTSQKIISIDRVPPMESSPDSESMLVAPATDFGRAPEPSPPSAGGPAPVPAAPAQSRPDSALAQEISQEVEWKGGFLRRVREARRISIEEMSSTTKVGKNYLQAIEEENFGKLPAAVFLRGFITQVAKTLRLPHDQVVAAYMARYQQSRADKNGK